MKCDKEIRGAPNVIKVQSHVMFNGTVKCDKEIRGAPNVIKVQSHVMFVLHNVRTVSSNVRKKLKYQL